MQHIKSIKYSASFWEHYFMSIRPFLNILNHSGVSIEKTFEESLMSCKWYLETIKHMNNKT